MNYVFVMVSSVPMTLLYMSSLQAKSQKFTTAKERPTNG
jgi:hypothetical protein